MLSRRMDRWMREDFGMEKCHDKAPDQKKATDDYSEAECSTDQPFH